MAAAPDGFLYRTTVTFGEVDAAGIVFYPRYVEMLSRTVEAWCDEGLGYAFQEMHVRDGVGVPTVQLGCRFLRASRLGDRLTFALKVVDIGRSTIDVAIACRAGEELRMEAEVRLVYTQLQPLKSQPIPDDLRSRIAAFRISATTGATAVPRP